jgi:hypothetical protein
VFKFWFISTHLDDLVLHRGALALYKASRRLANVHQTIVGLSNTRIAFVSIMHVGMDPRLTHLAEKALLDQENNENDNSFALSSLAVAER